MLSSRLVKKASTARGRGEEDGARERVEKLQADNRRLRRLVRQQRARLQGRPDLGYVFIVTYGRSGSTLLMGLLNGLPGYLLRGENRNALGHLFSFHQALVAERTQHRRRATRRRTSPWFGIADVPVGRITRGVRKLALETVLRPEPDTRVTGFKEIRWFREDVDDYVAWLQEVFPGARFVINTRRLEDVLASGWWAEGDRDAHEELLRRTDARLVALAVSLGEAAYHVRYDDYVADPCTLRGLVEWLGETWDEETVRSTMAVEHSLRNRSRS